MTRRFHPSQSRRFVNVNRSHDFTKAGQVMEATRALIDSMNMRSLPGITHLVRRCNYPNCGCNNPRQCESGKHTVRCDHDWIYSNDAEPWDGPDHCARCGMSFIAYTFNECP